MVNKYSKLKVFKQKYDPYIIDVMVKQGRLNGLSDKQIAALVANSMFESGHNIFASNGSFLGLFQWHKNQQDHFDDTLQSQLNYLFTDVKRGRWPQADKNETFNGWNPKHFKIWNNPNSSVQDITKAFSDGYERHGSSSNTNLRVKAAEVIYDIINSSVYTNSLNYQNS